ncbi:nucleotide pyrophosphohydrolase [Nonomuraea sp. NPDC050536]|uniref:nucleotide pyrophosphohydrolase n=1 Tax=Nonomuraea sp. NPDC050536 TaxID=3364366 RepID=UPI0037C5F1E5
MTELEQLAARYRDFTRARDWEQFHTPKNLVMALSGEVGELVAEYQWLAPDEPADPDRVRGELADVLLYLVRLADVLDVNLIEAAHGKLDESEIRYDADLYRGSARKAPPLP